MMRRGGIVYARLQQTINKKFRPNILLSENLAEESKLKAVTKSRLMTALVS